jgi:hypothetical protein
MIPDEMVVDLDVLGLVVLNRIMSNLDGLSFSHKSGTLSK